MKKLMMVLLVLTLAMTCVVLMAQNPMPPAGGAPAGRGGGRGMAGPVVPPATGAMLDVANKISDAINKQDADTLTKMLAADCVYLDEDGHSPAVSRWVTALTTGTPAKKFEISGTHGQMWDNVGWVSFNYTLTETTQATKGAPFAVKGTASLVLTKQGADWKISMIHGALTAKIAGMTQ